MVPGYGRKFRRSKRRSERNRKLYPNAYVSYNANDPTKRSGYIILFFDENWQRIDSLAGASFFVSCNIARKQADCKTLKIDEAMAEKAVELGSKIGVVATVASTVAPSCNLVRTKAKEANKDVTVNEYLVNGALDILMSGDVDKHNELVIDAIRKAEAENDVVVLAQGSMTAILPLLKDNTKPILTSPRLAVERVKKELGL